MSMSFTADMRKAADPIFEAIFQQPFVQGIGKGELAKEQLIHYVKQDYEYLNAFMRVYGIGISKCESREDIAMFQEKLGFILNSEVHPHHNFCQVAGVTYEQLQGYTLAPTALHYTSHMISSAQNGTFGEVLAALLPCPWVYLEVGQRLIGQYEPSPQHPFYEWMMFYGDQPMVPRIQRFRDRLDMWAKEASEKEKQRMKEHFLIGCQLEYMFFEMAYHVEDWPFAMAKKEQTNL